ncbi:Mur ligase family protein [Gemella sp. GH3]|uniref:Mur ligase family protein n=1 Tax=unclassified Gemella TaxID=2624949 RepID=UPI0015D0AD6F|nr:MULTISPECIES: Mur ligase family protein [unclassified Gemella]MBF0714391.1 Mur ligase family protein [Gemella sp. GH3.1]NYS51343.1 Mur ligase family protein [Gemella sp. GH3]
MTIFYRNIAKTVRIVSRLAGKKGTDLPGKILRKIDNNILNKLAQNFDEIVFVTGTNGKTTISNLIGYTLKKAGVKIINNYEGANMLDGIISTFAIQTDKNTKIAIIEIDEGSIKKVMKYITPTKFVFNNFFRDQIDRFGEIDALIATIGEQLKNKDIQLILNIDDPFVARLSEYGKNNIYFGIDVEAYEFKNIGLTESKFCPKCGEELIYSHIHYSQLGHYKCDNCDFQRKNSDYSVTRATVDPLISLSVNGESMFSTIQLGSFNIYNILSAYATLSTLGLDSNKIISGLSSYTSQNGRMQTISDGGNSTTILNLAKNPAGMNVSLDIASTIDKKENINYLIILNDNGADGLDISWIWDSNFEILQNQNIETIICSGKRAKELALRLKYADIKANIIVNENIKKAVSKLKVLKGNYNVVIPNYTALIETQKELEMK